MLTAGSLDPSFGVGGKAYANLAAGSGLDEANDAVVDGATGDVIVVGRSRGATSSSYVVSLARFNSAGNPVAGFGTGGKVVSGIATQSPTANAYPTERVALQADGKIVVSATFGGDFVVARFKSDGSVDSTFGSGGSVAVDLGGADEARGLAIRTDGKIVVAGRAGNAGASANVGVVRLNADGTRDTDFGSDGIATFDGSGGGRADQANDVALVGDKILVTGEAFVTAGDKTFVLARIGSGGTLDSTFGVGGTAVANFAGTDAWAEALAVQADGKIVAVGATNPGANFDYAVARFTADGAADASFGLDGMRTVDFTLGSDYARSVAVDTAGRLVVAGEAAAGGGKVAFSLARLSADGELDASFDGDGRVVTDPTGVGDSYGRAVAVLPNRNIVVAGHAVRSGSGFDFAVARYIGSTDPVVTAGVANVSAAEGQVAAAAGTYSDPLGRALTLTASSGVIVQNPDGTWSWSLATDDGPANGRTVTITATAGNGDAGTTSFVLAVANVAPTGTLNVFPNAVGEGTPVTVSLTGVTDPSSVDAAAGFEYAFDFGSGYGAFGSGGSASFTPADDGVRTVRVAVRDKDGGVTEYATTVDVANVAPTATITGSPATSGEGTAISLGSGVADPGSADTFTYAWTVTKDGEAYTTGTGSAFGFTPDDDGSYEVTLVVTDDDGGSSLPAVVTVLVTNVAPTLAVSGPASASEGSTYTLDLSSSDPGDDAIASWTINWGDGTTELVAGDPSFVTHVYADDGNYTITATATDEDGTYASPGAVSVSVANVAPTPQIVSIDAVRVEGTAIAVTGSATDPAGANDALSYAWAVYKNDSATAYATGAGTGLNFTPGDNGSYRIVLMVSDEDGGSASVEETIVVANVVPTLTVNLPQVTVAEGQTAVNGGAWGDVSADVVTLSASLGTVVKNAGGTWSWSYDSTDDLATTVTITATDEDGGLTKATFALTVTNVAPAVSVSGPPVAVSGPPVAVRGREVTFTGSFVDPGADSHPSQVWAVKNATGGTVATGSGSSVTFTPAANGTYTVTYAVTDDNAGEGSASATLTVVTAALLADPVYGGQALFVGGTSGGDAILVGRLSNGAAEVFVNGEFVGPFAFTGRIAIEAGAGSDLVTVLDSRDAWVYGGGGNDLIMGGSGDDVLLGGDGNDLLVGGSGRDLLVGGNGADRIVGSAHDDILIAGRLTFGDLGLKDVMAEWTRTDAGYSTRIGHLRRAATGGLNGTTFLITADDSGTNTNERTVGDEADNGRDVLTGASGSDWFLFKGGEDRVTDLHDEVFANDLGWIASGV